MKNVFLGSAIGALLAAPSLADNTVLEEVTVTGLRERLYQAGMLKDVIQKTEVISNISIEKMNAASLTEAIAEAPGVRVNNECSMCGVKRVMLNGLRGEHTTILVDGIPTYTMMSGFYGLDAAASAGIGNIEIARGAGASLIAPEAIGGTINLVTKEASENGVELDLAAGELGYRKGSVVATALANEDTTRLTLIGQYDTRDQYDGDDNGVSENPELENTSLTMYLSQDLGTRDNVRLRVNHTESEIFGGPTGTSIGQVKADYHRDPNFASASLFVDDDVRKDYIGRGWETTEWIQSDRDEVYLSWLHEFSSDLNMQLSVAHNEHTQDSFYEGFIYEADDEMTYLDARFHWAVSDDHLLTVGADNRAEELRSQTNSTSPAYVSDSFDYDTQGFYVQDTWSATENLEIAMALRFDQVEANFVDASKPGTEIDESITSPRIDMRYSHNDQWTSRFSFGRGYRAPLSFFESDHGILDASVGFDIQIDELERSSSYNYALSYEAEALAVTGSLSHTNVENLAALDENNAGVPVLTQSENDASVLVADVALTWNVRDDLALMATAENIDYSDEFKSSYGVVPVEQRIVLSTDWEFAGWDLYASATWVGSRDLSEYGVPESPSFDAAGTEAKSQDAESYWTVDMRVAKVLSEQWQVYAGVSNLFGYTQAEDMETPLFYEGGEYDVAHIYGPLRGREAYAGVKYTF
ncbi:TonB-dependent receptor [uncultured Spongiibacter sp.]|uniref:TonB-dependent receptor plug domain-containing protein n=1 Tax=uncultured Spongiibacter sp. TaxID=870896 RepID=UPI00259345C6|nr:TonB-dependent receptor [uncultured Spongiibacter sp.]